MTANAEQIAASAASIGPTTLRAAGPLTLLTWPALARPGRTRWSRPGSGGVSAGPYATLNLSLSVGDDPARVLENRRRLATALGAGPDDFVFARQVHGAGVRVVRRGGPGERRVLPGRRHRRTRTRWSPRPPVWCWPS